MNYIYLDNSATTPVSNKAADKALEIISCVFGNPSSLHGLGLKAEIEIENAREIIASSLSVKSRDIYFTSGGTEANNTIILGAAQKQIRNGKRIIVSSIEHSSVIESARELENRGFEVVYLKTNRNGVIDLDELEKQIDAGTTLVSVMTVNNETGAIQPVDKIKEIIKSKNRNTLFHTDAVQAYGKIKLSPVKWDVDFLTVSAHKIHAPKNCGAMYVKNASKILPLLYGGEQQKKVRPGTEISSLIPAFGTAVSEFDIQKNHEKINKLNEYAREKLSKIDAVSFNSTSSCLPYILNISVKGIRSETMLHFLEEKNIFVSSGSACAKGEKSHVLKAMDIADDLIDSAIRISFSKYNNTSDVDALVKGIIEGTERLSKKHERNRTDKAR